MIFHMRAVQADSEGYYYTRWDEAIPITVRAETKAEAYKEVWRIVGEPRNGRHWEAKLDRIEPEPITKRRAREKAWDEGYSAAATMARSYGHTDHWEGEPSNPYRHLKPEPVE